MFVKSSPISILNLLCQYEANSSYVLLGILVPIHPYYLLRLPYLTLVNLSLCPRTLNLSEDVFVWVKHSHGLYIIILEVLHRN